MSEGSVNSVRPTDSTSVVSLATIPSLLRVVRCYLSPPPPFNSALPRGDFFFPPLRHVKRTLCQPGQHRFTCSVLRTRCWTGDKARQ